MTMQDDMWNVAVLRPTKQTPLAKTGDNEHRQIVTELTLVCKRKASGIIADNKEHLPMNPAGLARWPLTTTRYGGEQESGNLRKVYVYI